MLEVKYNVSLKVHYKVKTSTLSAVSSKIEHDPLFEKYNVVG